jgi:tRNA (cytidine/uridine-2'-O-)-methyltransferase
MQGASEYLGMTNSAMMHLPSHNVAVALLQPQIAPNTGNIARLCVATGAQLHLVRPLGFILSDKQLRRSAMDYWPRLKLNIHDTSESFFESMRDRRLWYFDSAGKKGLWEANFCDGDVLVFGSETKGIASSILELSPLQTLRLPQVNGERCLNLATAAGIALYEALRQAHVPH